MCTESVSYTHLLKALCAEQGRGFFRVLAVQLKIAILGKADQRVRMSPVSYTHLDVYKRQIYYCDDLPHPTKEHEAFIEKGVERLLEILNISNGKALVLFTACLLYTSRCV